MSLKHLSIIVLPFDFINSKGRAIGERIIEKMKEYVEVFVMGMVG